MKLPVCLVDRRHSHTVDRKHEITHAQRSRRRLAHVAAAQARAADDAMHDHEPSL
jgi:hypothetical protein